MNFEKNIYCHLFLPFINEECDLRIDWFCDLLPRLIKLLLFDKFQVA